MSASIVKASRSRRTRKSETQAMRNRPAVAIMPRRLSRQMLLAGSSALALLWGAPGAHAKVVGGGAGTVVSAPTNASNAAQEAAKQAQQAAQNAQQSLTRATRALQSLQSVQA